MVNITIIDTNIAMEIINFEKTGTTWDTYR